MVEPGSAWHGSLERDSPFPGQSDIRIFGYLPLGRLPRQGARLTFGDGPAAGFPPPGGRVR